MDSQYTYTHTCHHIAYGPILSNHLIYLPLLTHTRPHPNFPLQKIHIHLPSTCPFCADSNLHESVPTGSGILVILGSSSISYSSPSTHPTSSTSTPQASPNETWTILRICNVEEILTSDWNHGISISIPTPTSDDPPKRTNEHGVTGCWGERRQTFGSRQGVWTPMAWMPRPAGRDGIIVGGRGERVKMSRSWRGHAGEDASGFGWRGRVLAESRLPGMMSELGAFLKSREEEGFGNGRMMRGLRW